MIGTYLITSPETGHIYVGSTKDIKRRMETHRHFLRQGKHHNKRLQELFDEKGEDKIRFIPFMESKDRYEACLVEKRVMELMEPTGRLLNVSKGTAQGRDLNLPPQTKEERNAVRNAWRHKRSAMEDTPRKKMLRLRKAMESHPDQDLLAYYGKLKERAKERRKYRAKLEKQGKEINQDLSNKIKYWNELKATDPERYKTERAELNRIRNREKKRKARGSTRFRVF